MDQVLEVVRQREACERRADRVGAAGGGLHQDVAGVVHRVGVVAVATDHRVGARATVDGVGTRTTQQRVVAGKAIDVVGAGPGVNAVGTCGAVDQVVACTGHDQVTDHVGGRGERFLRKALAIGEAHGYAQLRVDLGLDGGERRGGGAREVGPGGAAVGGGLPLEPERTQAVEIRDASGVDVQGRAFGRRGVRDERRTGGAAIGCNPHILIGEADDFEVAQQVDAVGADVVRHDPAAVGVHRDGVVGACTAEHGHVARTRCGGLQDLADDHQVVRVDRAVQKAGPERGQAVVRGHDAAVAGGLDACVQPSVAVQHVVAGAAGHGVVAATAEDDVAAAEGRGQAGGPGVVATRARQYRRQAGDAGDAVDLQLMADQIGGQQVGAGQLVVAVEARQALDQVEAVPEVGQGRGQQRGISQVGVHQFG